LLRPESLCLDETVRRGASSGGLGLCCSGYFVGVVYRALENLLLFWAEIRCKALVENRLLLLKN
jgi:hypothetical protein